MSEVNKKTRFYPLLPASFIRVNISREECAVQYETVVWFFFLVVTNCSDLSVCSLIEITVNSKKLHFS